MSKYAYDWQELKVGDKVRATYPQDFVQEVERKLRNRVGVIVQFQMFSGTPIIEFPASGRRKAYKWVPPHPRDVTKEV